MHSDFAVAGKSARAALGVPEMPLDAIRSRSRAIGRSDRIRTAVVCATIAIGAIGAGAVGAKLYNGVQFWISGDKAALVLHSLTIESAPSAAALSRVAANATFTVTYPVGLPKDTRLTMLGYAPADRPNAVFVRYRNLRARFNASITLVDSATINTDSFSMPGQPPLHFGDVYQWRVGDETVLIAKNEISAQYASAIADAMRGTSPAASLAANQAILWRMSVMGGGFELADVAERYAPGGAGVLVDRGTLRTIAGLSSANRPLLRTSAITLSNIPYVQGKPDIGNATQRQTRIVAIAPAGVRAVAAVMRAAGESGRWSDCCEILYTPPTDGAYSLWTIPMTSSQPIRRYRVDAPTYAVTSLGVATPAP